MSSLRKKTKYAGEDQLLFCSVGSGEIFGHLQYIFNDNVKQPFTIKTNEKTRLIVFDKKAIELYCKDFLLEEFNSKYRFLKELKCLGETRLSFTKMVPLIARSKLKRVAKDTLLIR